jgi:competence protein ComEC
MNEWHKYPFVRIIIPFIAGIFLSMKRSDMGLPVQELVLLLVVFLVAALLFHKFINYRNRLIFGVVTFLALLLAGFLWHNTYNKYQLHHHFSTYYVPENTVLAQFEEFPEEKVRSYKSILRVLQLTDSSGKAVEVKGKVIAYFAKSGHPEDVAYGDKVVFTGTIERVEGAKNPAAFDYSKYLASRNIFHSVYLAGDNYRIIADDVNTIKGAAEKTRHYLSEVLRRYGLEGNEFSLATALVLGYDKYLAGEMRSWYTNAGAMHILCVSGLHVGIIYVVMMFLLGLLPFTSKTFNTLKVVLVILFIWGYAFVTGLEPAVMRASVMFTMVAFGKLLQRKARIYNTLAASAFIMLLYNPNMLLWVGFQMSYLAVFGIVWLQPGIYNWWAPKNRLADYFWGLVAVSLAAQIILFPLLLFYFHKISLIFFITNLFAIPMATGVLYLTLLLFALSWASPVAEYIATGLKALAKALNFLIEEVSALPAAYVDEIWIKQWHLLLLYGSLLFIASALIKTKKNIVPSLLGAAIVFFIIIGGVRVQKQINNQFILYHIREGLAMDFIQGDSSVFIADSSVFSNRRIIDYNIKGSWKSHYVNPVKLPLHKEETYLGRSVFYKKPFILFNNDIYFILDKVPDIISSGKLEVDYLVISGKPWIDVSEMIQIFDIRKKVLISGSTPWWLAEKWKQHFADHDVECYSTHREGAFIAAYR